MDMEGLPFGAVNDILKTAMATSGWLPVPGGIVRYSHCVNEFETFSWSSSDVAMMDTARLNNVLDIEPGWKAIPSCGWYHPGRLVRFNTASK